MMTDDERVDLRAQIAATLAGKSRSYVKDAELYAKLLLERLDAEDEFQKHFTATPHRPAIGDEAIDDLDYEID